MKYLPAVSSSASRRSHRAVRSPFSFSSASPGGAGGRWLVGWQLSNLHALRTSKSVPIGVSRSDSCVHPFFTWQRSFTGCPRPMTGAWADTLATILMSSLVGPSPIPWKLWLPFLGAYIRMARHALLNPASSSFLPVSLLFFLCPKSFSIDFLLVSQAPSSSVPLYLPFSSIAHVPVNPYGPDHNVLSAGKCIRCTCCTFSWSSRGTVHLIPASLSLPVSFWPISTVMTHRYPASAVAIAFLMTEFRSFTLPARIVTMQL
mmetsp:Transcript_36671/g.74460  ORF Transcript_36671/g.74460 Transcript_36671/m.74460 type:complete len:260 (+) Transcript_36671:4398-5177(+)